MKIVFMGTPLFAVYALEAIFQSDHEIVGVVTSSDKPAGRGKQLRQSEVKKFAVKNKLNLLQPFNLKDVVFLNNLRELIDCHGQPVSTISYYIHWDLVKNVAKNGYKISISGTAADELFTGYQHHDRYYNDEYNKETIDNYASKQRWIPKQVFSKTAYKNNAL